MWGLLPINFDWTLFVVPFLYPGFYFLAHYMSYDKKRASPGAMDNLSGGAINTRIVKYFIENPDQAPQNLRIILAGFGAEEAGLRGSRAFVKKHKQDLLAGKVYDLNVDGVADKDDFVIVKNESWQGIKYDEEFLQMIEAAMKEVGVKFRRYTLDAGGSDAAEFGKAGILTATTISAQDQTPKSNYHTYMDTLEHVDPEALRLMTEVVKVLVAKIDAKVGAGR
jgi:Zn-dependent M28 family amino/carboxypeptidase